MTFEPFDTVVVPFPFADRAQSVVRPALILSPHADFGDQTGVAVAAMITSAQQSGWPLDVDITDLAAAGLRVPCLVRMKLNTIEYGLIGKKIGSLAEADRAKVRAALAALMPG